MSAAAPTPTAAEEMRRMLGHFPTGMVVITAWDEEPVTLAIGSFASISLDPPLVGFFVRHRSTSWPRIKRAGSFAVNVLGEHHDELCRMITKKLPERFEKRWWMPACDGVPPLLREALLWIECDIEDVVDSGDHHLVVGAVQRIEVGERRRPLVFFRGDFPRIAEEDG